MKRKQLIITVIVLTSLLAPLVGCGISKEEYGAVVTARDSLKTERDSLQTEFDSFKTQATQKQSQIEADLKTAQSLLTSTKTDLTSTKSQLTAVQTELGTTKTERDKAKTDLDSTKAQLTKVQATVDSQAKTMAKAKLLSELVSVVLIPQLTGEKVDELTMGVQWLATVMQVDDPEVKRLFQAVLDAAKTRNQAAIEAELKPFYLYVLRSLSTILTTK